MKYLGFFLLVVLGLAAACGPLAPTNPTVIISSPASGSQYQVDQEVAVQSTSGDQAGLTSVELFVDTQPVKKDNTPSEGQPQFTVIQTWKATSPGTHRLLVRATNTKGATGEAAVDIIVLGPNVGIPTVTATTVPTVIATVPPPPPPPTLTPVPTAVPVPSATSSPQPCVPNSVYVSDVTVPDGMTLPPGTSFVKTWRVTNNGTCLWDTDYSLVLIGGEQMNAPSPSLIPNAAPGSTVDISVPMVAPTVPGPHTGIWRLRAGNGVVFGTNLTVVLNVPGAPPPPSPTNTTAPPACAGTPVIASFTANKTTVEAGQSVTLSWGQVTNATSAVIDPDIGGVATPGNRTVTPAATTTYTLTATCGGNQATRQVTITVVPKNDISNFSGISAVNQLSVSVNYQYNGLQGSSNIFMAAYAEDNSGTGAPGTGYVPGGPLVVGNGTATVVIKRVTPGAAFTSTRVRVCMYIGGGAQFYCEVFNYTKTW